MTLNYKNTKGDVNSALFMELLRCAKSQTSAELILIAAES